MPELLAQLPVEEQGGAVTNNNPVADMTVDNIEADLWRALRGANLDRFQLLLDTIAIGKTNVITIQVNFCCFFFYSSLSVTTCM